MEEAEEEVGDEAVGDGVEARGVGDDGAPPRLACAGAADNVAGVQAAEDLEEQVRRRRRRPRVLVHRQIFYANTFARF